jgi:carotenoid cleavage dioxygenase
VFDPEGSGIPIHWSDDYGARLGVMPRDGSNADVTWYEIDPCYVFHPMNAFEDGDKIILDVARTPRMAFGPNDPPGEPTVLHRWIIDQEAGKVIDQPLDDRPAEFPRVADNVVGMEHRYGYMLGTGGGSMENFGGELYRYDLRTGSSQTHRLPAGCAAGEPVFAAAGDAEGDGYVMTFVYDASRNKSDLVILDATDFEKEPVARIHLPTRVPAGFHGSWIPDQG